MNTKCINCFKVLSTRNRYVVFNYIKMNNKSTISELTKLTGLKQPTVTFHVNELENTGIIKKRKEGKFVYCELNVKCENCPILAL